jgi:hypothetical protein
MRKIIAAALGITAIVGTATGCALKTSDAAKFREPLPQYGDAVLGFAGSSASGANGQAASVHIQGGGAPGGGTPSPASFYEFTWSITNAVDTVTVAIVGEIVAVASLPPTTIDANHAVWGPGGSALDPVQWRLTVTLVGDEEYDYAVDGRAHLSQSEADWRSILTGHGFGMGSASYRSGSFVVDEDALRALDPTRTSSTGSVTITYDARSYPLNAKADVVPNDGTGRNYHVAVQHAQDGAGTMGLTALSDMSTPPDGANESVSENSRWDTTGAGRADVRMTGGDFGSTVVLASQCWSDAFAQVYYTDNVSYQPTTGSVSACAYAQASF